MGVYGIPIACLPEGITDLFWSWCQSQQAQAFIVLNHMQFYGLRIHSYLHKRFELKET